MKIISKLLNRETISYLVFGVLTTIVNLVSYKGSRLLGLKYTTATVIAWILAVAFAYITNKLYVFESKSFDKTLILKEMSSFITSRLFSGLCDFTFMVFAVEFIHMNDFYSKIITNVFVVVINYVLSKLFVFKTKQ